MKTSLQAVSNQKVKVQQRVSITSVRHVEPVNDTPLLNLSRGETRILADLVIQRLKYLMNLCFSVLRTAYT